MLSKRETLVLGLNIPGARVRDVPHRMTQSPSYYHPCTGAALTDELVKVLSSKNTVDVVEEEVVHGSHHNSICIHRMYIEQAEALLYKINLYDPLPEFVIFNEDIPEGLAQALKSIGRVEMNEVITEAVRRLYESVNPDYFHTNGIYGKTLWRISK